MMLLIHSAYHNFSFCWLKCCCSRHFV